MKKKIIPNDKNYYLILDTNVIEHLVNAYFYIKKPKPWAKEFYDSIKKNKVNLLGTDLTFFEYLRGSESLEEYKTKLKYLEELFDNYISGIDILDAIHMTLISNIYSNKKACKKKLPSLVDLYLTLILKNLSNKQIMLATFNYKDFPTTFLDRETKSIDFGYEIGSLCFYKFNKTKFRKCLKKFFNAPYNRHRKKHKKK